MLNPILASSALRRMRSVRTQIIAGAYVAVLLALVLAGMSSFAGGDAVLMNKMSEGIQSYALLIAAQFALIVLVAPAMTASSIAGERDRQTLELLLVTNTGSLRIVVGKLMESFAFMALLILCGLPVTCLTMLTGGVTIFDILFGTLFLLCCAFAAACVGVLCSSFMRNTVGATIVSYIALLLIGAGTIMPLVVGITQGMTDRLYDPAAYAAMTSGDGMRMLPALLYVNPGVGLVALLEGQTAMLRGFTSGRGRLPALFLMLDKIGYGRVVAINMGVMVALGLLLVGVAALLVRPRRVRVRRKP